MSSSTILRAAATSATGSTVPGTIGTPAARMSSRARVLEPIASIALAGRADEDDARLLAGAREGGVLGEEAVAGMDGLGAGLARDLEDPLDVEVAVGRRVAAEQVGLARARDVRRVAVELGVDRHRGDRRARRSARMMRTAISPRLAMRILENIVRAP